MLKIGPTFSSELVAAGISLEGLGWDTTNGLLFFPQPLLADGVTPNPAAWTSAQEGAAQAVLAAHDPTKQLVVVPTMVSNYQARTVLIQRGLFAKADAALRGADQTVAANQMAVQAWDYANDFYRDSDFVASIGQALGLTSAEIDQLFTAANAVR